MRTLLFALPLLTIHALFTPVPARPSLISSTWTSPSSTTSPAQTDDAVALVRTAAVLYQQRKFDEALALCAKAKALAPGDYGAYAMTALIYQTQRKFKPASDEFAEAIRREPNKKELYLAKAEVDMFRNARADAIAAARKATEVDPNFAEAFAMLGRLLGSEKEQTADAVAALRTAIRLKPGLLRAYSDLGRTLMSAKDEKGAEDAYRQGMAADPAHMAGRFDLGRMMVKQGRLREARELWEARGSDKDNTYPQLIEVLTWAENRQRATDALAKKPDDPDALIDLGLAVMAGPPWVWDGREEKALVHLRKALELKPDNARAQFGVVKAYVQMALVFEKYKPDVERELAKLRRLDPKLADEAETFRKQYRNPLVGAAGPAGPAQ